MQHHLSVLVFFLDYKHIHEIVTLSTNPTMFHTFSFFVFMQYKKLAKQMWPLPMILILKTIPPPTAVKYVFCEMLRH